MDFQHSSQDLLSPCSIDHFAEMFASKLGVRADILRKTLWGDFYLHSKTKRIMKGAQVMLTIIWCTASSYQDYLTLSELIKFKAIV